MKTAVVDVGGGLRGIYASGVLDRCMEDGVRFDAGIGVSAGSANVASYIAGQKGRNYKFYTEYSSRREYMSLHNFLVKKSYIDMDYLYGKLSKSDGEYPLDYAAIAKSPVAFLAVATDADTGKVKYFDKNDMKPDNYDILKASCSIPFVCRPYSIEGVPYYDGALSDPVPVEKAFSMGCDRVVLILTKPREVRRTPEKDRILASRIRKKYPLAAAQLERRAEKYNAGVDLAESYEKQGRLLIIAPDDTCGMDTLTRDTDAMRRFYEKGLRDGERILDTMKYNLSDRMLNLYNSDFTHERRDLDWVRKNAVIIHYYGVQKPWKKRYQGKLDIFYRELKDGQSMNEGGS